MTLFDPELDALAPAAGPTERIRLVVAYDGAPFSGFARNEGVRTVGGDLTQAIATVIGGPVELTCAGRTDKGVHARAQVVTFDAPVGAVEPARLTKSLNKLCGPAIAVWGVESVAVDFDARFPAMVLACDAVIGEHDFACFCRRPKRRDGVEASLVRRVTEARWFDDGDG